MCILNIGSKKCRFDWFRGHHFTRPRYHRLVKPQQTVPLQEEGCQAIESPGTPLHLISRAIHPYGRVHHQVAAKTAHQFNPSVKIRPIHANIKDPEYDVSWFKGFDIVMNALDNIGTFGLGRY